MSTWLLLIATACYAYAGIDAGVRGSAWWGVWAGYASANCFLIYLQMRA